MTEGNRTMHRHVVPVDDHAYAFGLTSDPVATGLTDDGRSVEFWVEYSDVTPEIQRRFQVYGTGHPLPSGARWVGTCPRTRMGLVWHLFELSPPQP